MRVIRVAGGLESISLVQPNANRVRLRNAWLEANKPGVYATMIETADLVAARYSVSREAQDVFALESQKRTAAAQAAGLGRSSAASRGLRSRLGHAATSGLLRAGGPICSVQMVGRECSRPERFR